MYLYNAVQPPPVALSEISSLPFPSGFVQPDGGVRLPFESSHCAGRQLPASVQSAIERDNQELRRKLQALRTENQENLKQRHALSVLAERLKGELEKARNRVPIQILA